MACVLQYARIQVMTGEYNDEKEYYPKEKNDSSNTGLYIVVPHPVKERPVTVNRRTDQSPRVFAGWSSYKREK